MSEKKFSIAELDELCDIAVRKVQESGFQPDTVIGITTGGAILGKIMSLKLGCRFCPDYRKYGVSQYFPLYKDASKILVVDDKMDFGGTFRKCLVEIIKLIHPEMDATMMGLTIQWPSDMDIRFFVFVESGDAPYSPHYSLYKSLDIEFPWGQYSMPLNSVDLKVGIKASGYRWAQDVVELMENISKLPPPSLGKFYSQRPLTTELLSIFSTEEGQIVLEITVKKTIDEKAFPDFCREHGLHFYGTNNDHILHLFSDKPNSFQYSLNADKTKIYLKFRAYMLRTYDEMCRNCELRSVDSPTICLTCNKYVRSIEVFERIYLVIEKLYSISEINTIVQNKAVSKNIGDQIVKDLERKGKK